MFLSNTLCYAFWVLVSLQTLPSESPETGAAAAPAKDVDGGGGATSFFQLPVMLLIMLLLFYFIILLPQQKAAKNQQAELNSLKKNDRVVTSSGIHGVVLVASPDSPTVTIRIDDATNAKMTVNREAIAKISREESKSGDA